jgi:hypothetical protein
MFQIILTALAVIAMFIWDFLWTILGWLMVIGFMIGMYQGCTGKSVSADRNVTESNVLETALRIPPRSVYFVRRDDCAFAAVPSWSALERGIQRQQGTFHMHQVGTEGFIVQFDITKKFGVFTYTEEACEKLRATAMQRNSWAAEKR